MTDKLVTSLVSLLFIQKRTVCSSAVVHLELVNNLKGSVNRSSQICRSYVVEIVLGLFHVQECT